MFGAFWDSDKNSRVGPLQWHGQMYFPNVTTMNSSKWTSGMVGGMFFSDALDGSFDLLYLKNITLLKKEALVFTGYNSPIVINNVNVPTVIDENGNTVTLNCGDNHNYPGFCIYVPNSAVNDYKAAWPDSAYNIFPISSLNSSVMYATEQDWRNAYQPKALVAEYMGLSSSELTQFMTDNNLTY